MWCNLAWLSLLLLSPCVFSLLLLWDLDFVWSWARVLPGRSCPAGGVHLFDGPGELLDAAGVGEQGLLPCLSILGYAGLKLFRPRVNDESTVVGLAGAGDHVLNKVPVAGSATDSDIVLGYLKLAQGEVGGGLARIDRPVTTTLR